MKACVIGLGYIGLPTAIIAASRGIEVVGVDINPQIVERTNRGELHIVEPGLGELLRKVVSCGSLQAYTEPQESDAYFIMVPTPFKEEHKPDISYVEAATRSVIPYLKKGDLFVIESTSPVGTTEKMTEIIFGERPELREQIYIAYCPERVLPGNIVHELIHNARVIGGINEASTQKAIEFYKLFTEGELHGTNCRAAELCKLAENSYRDVQIAFANELSMICDKAGIFAKELIELANKHPRVNILKPGCGVGGHCIAVDPYFITSDFPSQSKLISTAREVNNNKALWCVEKIKNAIAEFEQLRERKPVVAMMGLTYKADIDDCRESPAVQIAREVISDNQGAQILICEPNVEEKIAKRILDADESSYKFSDPQEVCDKADIVVFLVNHKKFAALDYRSQVVILDFCSRG